MESLKKLNFKELIDLAKKCEIDVVSGSGWKIYGHLRSLESLVKTREIKINGTWLDYRHGMNDDHPPTLKETTSYDLISWDYDLEKDELSIKLLDTPYYGGIEERCRFDVKDAHRYFHEFFEDRIRGKIEGFLYLQYTKQEAERVEAEKEKILKALLSS